MLQGSTGRATTICLLFNYSGVYCFTHESTKNSSEERYKWQTREWSGRRNVSYKQRGSFEHMDILLYIK